MGFLKFGTAFLVCACCLLVTEFKRPERKAVDSHDPNCPIPEMIGRKFGYVDRRGRVVIAPRFDGADAFSEGLAVVLDSGRFGYIDSRGAMAIPAVYRHARAFHGGYAPVRRGDRWLIINRAGRALPDRSPE